VDATAPILGFTPAHADVSFAFDRFERSDPGFGYWELPSIAIPERFGFVGFALEIETPLFVSDAHLF
jgi:hypothetical protein